MITIAKFLSEIENFLIYLRRHGYSDDTLTAYHADLTELSQLLTGKNHENLHRKHFVDVLKILSSRHLHPHSLGRKLSTWRQLVRFHIEKGNLDKNPLIGIKAPKSPVRLPKSIDETTLNTLLDSPEQENHFFTQRDSAIFELLYGSGLRISEAVALNLHDIDLMNEWVKIRHGKGGKERTVPLGKKSIRAIQQYLPLRGAIAQEEALFINQFGKRISTRRVSQCLEAWSIRHGSDRHISPHMLRHSFASHILQSSHDIRAVQELLGHSRLSTTQIYTHLDFDHLTKIYDQTHPRAKKKDHLNSNGES